MYESERGLIGSILIDNSVIYELYDKIKPEMLNDSLCQLALSKSLVMYDLGKPIDAITLASEMANEDVSADEYLPTLMEFMVNTPTSVAYKEYANEIIDNYKSNKFSIILNNTDRSSNGISDEISHLISELEELQGKTSKHAVSMSEIVSRHKGNYFTENNLMSDSVKTGFDELDDCLGGLMGGDTIVIGARPAVGKSAFATQIIGQVASQGKKVGYFNLEMSDAQVYERFISRQAQLQLPRIRRARAFLGTESEQFEKGNEELSKLNIVISTGSMSENQIKAECRHQNFDLIVIDYLQLVKCSKRCENRAKEVGEVSRSLKELAMELNVPIIILSQLNRVTERMADKEPSMADLRETGDIEQDASVIILLWKLSSKPENSKYKGLKVEKNRQGELMNEAMLFDGELMTFCETKESTADVKRVLGEDDGFGFEESIPFS